MPIKEISLCQFFNGVNQLQRPQVDSCDITVSSFFTLRHTPLQQNKIVLKDNQLFVSKQENEKCEFTHELTLNDGIKFKRIFMEGYKGNGSRQLKGFRLINAQDHFIDILIPIEPLARIWVQQLAKIISEVGFSQIYETVRKIGRGSTASVYEVRRRDDQQLFAAKVVLKAYLKQKEERAQALSQEIALLRAIEHENIIKLHGVFESEQAIYLIFERLTGGNLLERINSQRGLSLAQTRTVIRGIAQGLAYLHRFGIAHRDLKLENILLRNECSLEPVIADFGLAVLAEEQPYLYYRCGTPGYVAPEIIRMKENKPVRVACDIFSAGAIFHLLLTNSYLFSGSSGEEVYFLNRQAKILLKGDKYDNIHPPALALLRKMLTVRVIDRITADEILDQQFLQEYIQGRSQKQEVSPAATQAGDGYIL